MYLGIDFLISSELKPYVIEVNVGLPGGAQEYHLTHLVHFGRPSDIFNRIEETWEAKIWFGEAYPPYLRPNLYEDVVAQTTLQIPASVFDVIRETSIKIERFYEALDLFSLPKACFEE